MTAWRTWSRSQVGCRALVALLPVVALLVAPVPPSVPMIAIVAAGSVLWATWPELAAGPLVLLLVMVWWATTVPDPVRPSVLVAAAVLQSAHVAGVLAAYGPARVGIDRRLVWMWIRRGLLAFLGAPLAYVGVIGLNGAPDQPLMWPVAVAALVALTFMVGLRFREQPAQLSPQAGPKSVDNTLS